MENLLFYGGIALMSIAATGAVVSAAVLRAHGKRLKAALEAEFGKKRH